MANYNSSTKAPNYSHGHRCGYKKTRTYSIWTKMMTRCFNEKVSEYKYYGSRGITVCDRWRSFQNFLADMGDAPNGTSIDRIDNYRGYEPTNCRWATVTEQNRNTRTNIYLTAFGKTKLAVEWAQDLGIDARKIRQRYWQGRSHEECLSKENLMPKLKGRRQGRFSAQVANRT